MRPRDIIAQAWATTKREGTLRKWGFISSIFDTLLSTKLLIYQVWFYYSYFVVNDPISPFTMEKYLMDNLPPWLSISIISLFVVLLIVELFLPTICLGAIIGLAAKAKRGEELKGGLVLALYNFGRLFVIKELFVLASIPTILTCATFVLRYGGEDGLQYLILGLLLFFAAFSGVIRFFTSFAEEGVVIKKYHTFESMSRSFKLIVSHLGHILFIFILLFVISLRIILNALMILLIPGLVIGVFFFFSWFLPTTATWILSVIVGLGLVGAASYFFAYIDVFKQTVWTYTFMELSAQRDLDIIDDEE